MEILKQGKSFNAYLNGRLIASESNLDDLLNELLLTASSIEEDL